MVRGQYTAGTVGGRPVRGYREEEAVARDSTTETFVALRVGVENWRWAGVPFLLADRQVPGPACDRDRRPLQTAAAELFRTVECEGDFCDLPRRSRTC